MKSLLIVSAILLLQFSYAQNDSINYLSISKDEYHLQYPSTWTLDSSKLMGTSLILFSALENNNDKFKDNINILIQDLKGQKVGIAEYKKISEEQLKNLTNNGKMIESSIITKNGKECYKVVYEMTQGIYNLKISSLCYIKNEKAFLITFTTEITKYDLYKKTGDAILNSFDIN